MKLLVLVLLLAVLVCVHADGTWNVQKKSAVDTARSQDYDFDATFNDVTIEARYNPQDPVFVFDVAPPPQPDLDGISASSSATVQAKAKTATQSAMKTAQKFGTSLSLEISLTGKKIYGSYQGKRAKTLSVRKTQTLTAQSLATIKDALSSFSMSDNERVAAIVPNLAGSMQSALDHPSQADPSLVASAATPNTGSQQALLSMFEKLKRRNRVRVGNYRYYVNLYTGVAFYVTPGQHSGTQIVLKNEDTGEVIESWEEGNHGRVPSDGLTFKCTHNGAVFNSLDGRPTAWNCLTSYWAFWCFRGPNHNCNANAKHQMEIADNPMHPPSHTAGICATNCPIRSFDC